MSVGTKFMARGLGAALGPQRVQGSALVGGPGEQSPPEAPEILCFCYAKIALN